MWSIKLLIWKLFNDFIIILQKYYIPATEKTGEEREEYNKRHKLYKRKRRAETKRKANKKGKAKQGQVKGNSCIFCNILKWRFRMTLF